MCEHASPFVCVGGNRGEILHSGVRALTAGVCAFKCAEGKPRESFASFENSQKKSGNCPYHRLVHIQCL